MLEKFHQKAVRFVLAGFIILLLLTAPSVPPAFAGDCPTASAGNCPS